MNKIIAQQLKKLGVAKMDSYDELKHTYLFKKHVAKIFKLNSFYIVRLDKSLTSATGDEILVNNWNKGNYPKHSCMKVQINKKMGNMLFVCGVYYDDFSKKDMNEYFNGWLPDEKLEIIEEVK